MRISRNLGLAAAIAIATSQAATAATADLSVTGTLAPAACALSFPDGGTLDFGELAPTLGEDDVLRVEASMNIDFQVKCSEKTTMTLHFSDLHETGTAKGGFFLVDEEEEVMGWVYGRFISAVADGATVKFYPNYDASPSQNIRVNDRDSPMLIEDADPAGYKDVAANLEFNVSIAQEDVGEFTGERSFRSGISVELSYL